MATIEPYATKAGQRYMVRYRKPGERTQTKTRGFRTKRDAERYAATIEVEKMRGEYVAPKLGMVTVDEIAVPWLERKETDLKPSAYRAIETSWRVHVQPRWGKVRLVEIDLDAVERWVADMGRTVYDKADPQQVVKKGSGATIVIRAYGVLTGILDSAVKAKRLAKNPARGVENLPRKMRKARTYLSHAQVFTLADAAGEHRTLVLLLAYTGLRWGEATGLRVKHLDLLRKRLTVTDNAVQVGKTIHVGSPKSYQHRAVGIPSFLVAELARQCEGKGRDDLVFPRGDGEHLRRPVSHSGWFTKALERSGTPRVTIHELRNTAASLAVAAGADVKALQNMLGHASAAMTLDVYADLFDDRIDGVSDALDRAALQAVVPKMCPREA